jgi:hypothetical protein
MKSLITSGVLIAGLALGGNAALAANAPAHKYTKPTSRAHLAIRAAPRIANNQFGVDVGQFFQTMLGGGLPVQDAMRARPSHGSSGYSDWSSPSYDSSSSASSAADSQASSDAENQAIQSMNDSNALNASTAAAEAANDAANAATLQTEINAGM